MMTVSTVNANTGIYESYTEVGTSIEEIPHAVVGSSSIPLIFPPHYHFPGKLQLHIEGGTAYGVDLVSAVGRCRELVDDDSKIVLDIILCY